jgi:large subunit ribosomal protein L30
MAAQTTDGARIEITQVRSLIGSQQRHRRTLRSLGIRRMRQTVVKPDRPEIRGMIARVAHLVEVRYAGEAAPLQVEPGQQPKGEGNPPAGPTVTDAQAAELRDAEEEALAVPGRVAPEDLVQNPPSLTSTDPPDAPKAPQATMEAEEQAQGPEPQPLPWDPDEEPS